jgi:hypothetical protein
MKVLLYDGRREKPERVVKLKLMEASGGVDLVVVNDDGDRIQGGTIATIISDGHLFIHDCLNPEIGLRIAKSHGGIHVSIPNS